jgi:RNA polymerase sigma-70 factor (ECF subfamily)
MSAGAAYGGSGASIDAIRAGSPDALAVLYREFGGPLYRLAYRLTGTREDAEDVVHDVFVGLPEALDRYEERGNFVGWLKRVTARVALMRLRGRRRQRLVPLETTDSGVTAPLDPATLALQTAVDALPERLRSVLVLKEIEGYAHAEVAELLGISVVASRVRLARALKRLRRMLEDGR